MKWVKEGLSSKQINQLIGKYREAGLRVNDRLGSHGVAHVFDDSRGYLGPIACITETGVGLIPGLPEYVTESARSIMDIAKGI
jgi:hypothetical protein